MLAIHVPADDDDDDDGVVFGMWVYEAKDIKARPIPKRMHLTTDTYSAKPSQIKRLCHGFKVEPTVLDVHSTPMSLVPFLAVTDVVAAAKAGRMPVDGDTYLCRYKLKAAMEDSSARKRKR